MWRANWKIDIISWFVIIFAVNCIWWTQYLVALKWKFSHRCRLFRWWVIQYFVINYASICIFTHLAPYSARFLYFRLKNLLKSLHLVHFLNNNLQWQIVRRNCFTTKILVFPVRATSEHDANGVCEVEICPNSN